MVTRLLPHKVGPATRAFVAPGENPSYPSFGATAPLRGDAAACPQAEAGAMLPGVTRTSARTLTFSTQDYLEGVKTGRALIPLALAR
ncbi:MAG TPA: hypothetical protein VMT45_00025 [Thermoanaerobaculaceae bacterium]|nr:hypothetical protein [Thermoanaerobaculaceae bacterium]